MTRTTEEDETNPNTMINRMLRAVAKQIAAVERKMDEEGVTTGEDDKILNGLSRTTDTLLAMLRRTENAQDEGGPDREALRGELTTRLQALLALPEPLSPAERGEAA